MNNSKYSGSYSELGFWNKLSKYAAKAGEVVVINALKLFYALSLGKATPEQIVKIIGALGYFISPIDAIPDLLPGGYVDDAGILIAAVRSIQACSDPEVVRAARLKANEWFG